MLVRRSPRTLAVWTVAGLATLVAARVIAGDIAALHGRARSAGAEVTAVVATRDLPLGRTLEGGDVEAALRFERHLPADALRSVDGLAGRVVTVPVVEGGVVTERHLGPLDRTGLDGVVPEGMRALRVVIDEAPHVAPGSVVDVLVTFDPGLVPPEIDATTTVVEGAVVVGADGDDRREAGRDARGVTLLVDEPAARRLAFAMASGIVTLALAPPEEACCPKPSSTPSSASSRD